MQALRESKNRSEAIADAIRAGVDINRLPTPTKQDRQSLRALKAAVATSPKLK